MSIAKRYLKAKPLCKVTFRLGRQACQGVETVHLVGEFNGWDLSATPMKRLKNGSFTVTVDLPAGQDHPFRYLLDGTRWENDWEADRYAPTPFGDAENSVVVV